MVCFDIKEEDVVPSQAIWVDCNHDVGVGVADASVSP